MYPQFRRQLSPLRSVSVSLALIAFAGCETPRGTRRPPPEGPLDPTAAAPNSISTMSARSHFFAGQIETEIILGNVEFGQPSASRESRESRDSRSGGDGGGASGGGARRGGGGGGGGGSRGGNSGNNSRSPAQVPQARDGETAPRIVTSKQPPVRLQLRLTNHGSETAEVEVLEFNSPLGNFVVLPKKITIAPGAATTAEPMTSRLGLGGTSIPLTIRLRHQGKTEQQEMILEKPAPAPAPIAPAPPTGPAITP